MDKKHRLWIERNYILERTYGVQFNDKETGNRGTRIVCFYINRETGIAGFNNRWIKTVIDTHVQRYLNEGFDISAFGNSTWEIGHADEGEFDYLLAISRTARTDDDERVNVYLTANIHKDCTEEQRLHYQRLCELPPYKFVFRPFDSRYDDYRYLDK